MNPIGYPKLHPVGSDPAPYDRRSDRSGSQQEPTCNRSDRSESFVGPTLSRSTRSRGVDRARADRLHTLHGIKWLTEHFDVVTKAQLNSPDDYRLLLCDGHDSHISAEFVDYAIKNNIEIILLPPHSSHLLQPLDVAIFSPLKKAISSRLHRLMQMGISRLKKAEWVEQLAKAREDAITSTNIFFGWRVAGLFPQNQHRILIQVPDEIIPSSTPKQPSTTVATMPF